MLSEQKLDNDNYLTNSNLDLENSAEIRNKIMELISQYAEDVHSKKPFIPGKSSIPVSGRVFGGKEIQMLVSSSLDFWLTTGRFNEEFEKRLGKFLGVKFVITTNSGSSANLLALSSLTSEQLGEKSLKPGDEVITVAAGFPTTVNPILQNNLIPIFIDVQIPSYVIDENLIEENITKKTKAIMIAHTLGNAFNIKKITDIARKHNLWLIEDCCDALGTTYGEKFVGTFGDLSTLSFYPAHHITMGEGGAVLTNNPQLKRIVESFRDWGRDCYCPTGKSNTCGKRFEWKLGDLPFGYDHKYTYSHVGYNLKITDMQAAIGLAQLDRLPEFIKIRKENFELLYSGLSSFEKFLILPSSSENCKPSWFGFPITVKDNIPFSRESLVNYLTSKLVDTRPIFAGNLIKQPYFKNKTFRTSKTLSNTDKIMNQSFWIGVFPGLSKDMLEYTIKQFETFIMENR
jgi:CDP-6-deoxy-D-xylo-4-hexulose-3-dehydrase|tara:strand:+ start:3968 stop:5341 length:1374 start_codon:yes stop_codon:yes gene_type:complete